MAKTFFKNLFRDIKKTLSRFLSIVIIIAVGVSFYAGVRATSPDMKMSADNYFRDDNLMDFKVISTLGLTKDDINEIKKQQGIAEVQGSYSLDAVIEKDKRSLVVNVNSLLEDNGINKITMVRGTTPKNDDEIVVEERFFLENKLNLNDTLVLKSGKEASIEDNLTHSEFKIVGTAISPLYVSRQRQLSSLGNGTVRGFVYVLPIVFKSEVYTEIYAKTHSSTSNESLLNHEEYTDEIKAIENNLKDLGTTRSAARYDEVVKGANDKIKDAEDKLNVAKKEAADKFADGYKKLDSAKDKLNKGKQEIKDNEVLFNKKIQEGAKQIEDGKKQIQAGEVEISNKLKDIEKGKLEIAEGRKNLEDSEKQLKVGKEKAAYEISNALGEKIKELEANLDDPANLQQYNILKPIYEEIKGKDFDSIYSILKEKGLLGMTKPSMGMEELKKMEDIKKSEEGIVAGKQQLDSNEKLLIQGESKIKEGKEELENNKKKIAASELQLNKEKQQGVEKLNKAKKDLEQGEVQLNENTKTLKEEEEKANGKFRDGEREIQESKDKIKDIKAPEWYVLGRSANVGYETYRQDSDRIDNIGKVFPLIFFLVAALVSLTTMTRMVQENRIEIGTFKALGYSRISIVAHYLIYSLSASLVGSLIGVSFGFRLFPPLIMKAYSSLYTIPNIVSPFNVKVSMQAALLAVAFTTVAAVAATLEELREVPASLMRPKPPKSGKNILLERVTFIWKRLGFTSKVTARNIFRYKQRLLMTVIGIAACTGLMITGFGLKEGIIGSTNNQFNKIYKYDMLTTLPKNLNEDGKNEMKSKVYKDSNIKSVLFTYSKNATLSKESGGQEDVYVVVPEGKEDFNKYINLTKRDKPLNLEEGAIITEKLSKLINKKVGDTLDITINGKVIQPKITGVTEHYIGHYVYISPDYYEKISGEKPTYNGFYGLLKSTTEESQNNTSQELRNNSKIQSVSFKNNAQIDIDSSMESVNSVVIILIVSAGVLAFVVIYNLTNININERKRELATIKLLGFYDNELAAYIYRENIILTIIGSLTGIVAGIFLNYFVITAAETNVMMFLKKVNPIYFLYSVILTMIFSVIVNLVMYKRFDKIDMIESLKSAE